MKLQFLVSTVNEDMSTIAARMNLQADAIIVNQCGCNEYQEYEYMPGQKTEGNEAQEQNIAEACRIRCYSFAERGVGLSRNNCLMRADREICVFSDEDIIYYPGAAKAIEAEFEAHPEADMILFNMDVPADRATYHISGYGRVRWYNCGRYPTYSFAARTEKLRQANVAFSLLFGGGAKYSNGEDSLFLSDCLKKGLKVYKTPVTIGKENGRPSTWFHGYNEKFFYDRGVLYRFLYKKLAFPMAVRFLLKLRGTAFASGKDSDEKLTMKQALGLMCKGIRMEM